MEKETTVLNKNYVTYLSTTFKGSSKYKTANTAESVNSNLTHVVVVVFFCATRKRTR